MSAPWEDRAALRDRLLPGTVDHAARHVPFYARTCAEFVGRIKTLPGLAGLPIVTKADLMREPDEFRDPEAKTALVQHTGGTTGRPLFIHRGEAEVAFLRQFFCAVDDGAASDVPLCVSLVFERHGDHVPIPYPGPVLNVSLDDPYWNSASVVTEPWTFLGIDARPVALVGLESQLRRLTCRLTENGFDFSRSAVTSLHTTGDLVTSRLRAWYESVWAAPLSNRWSMTEIVGGASECPLCGNWHLDPYVIAEALDPATREPIQSGYGVLVVTCLYPFVQKQPVIRYWTGDLVEVGPSTCIMDTFGWTFKGRAASCIVDDSSPGAKLLLSAADVYDLLDDYPDVASSRMFTSDPISDHSALGHLKFDIEQTVGPERTIRLVVETRYSAYLHAARAQDFTERVRAVVLQRHPDLQRAVDEGAVRFEVATALPNSLASFMPDEVE